MHLLRVALGYSRWPYKEVESCDNVGGAKDAPNPTSDKTIPPSSVFLLFSSKSMASIVRPARNNRLLLTFLRLSRLIATVEI